jgi:branched-subunit amino acid ABC-type transport system permease component
VTHAGDRACRHGRRSGSEGPPNRARGRGRPTGGHRTVLQLLLVLAFGLGLAAFTPGVAHAEGEAVTGTLQTSLSGPIEGVQVRVATPDGEEIDSVESDEDGKWSVDVPGPGEYVVSIDADDLPEGVTLSGEDTRTVTVAEGRRQPVNLGLEDGSRGAGGGGVRAVQLFVDGLRFGLLIAMCAVGLSLIFGTTGLTNFAHGELVTIGAVVAWYINVEGGIPLIPATLLAMVVGMGVGALNELGIWRPLRRYLILIFYGGRSNPYADYQSQRAVDYGLFNLTNRALFSIIISVVVLLLVAVMLQRTKIGKAMRAVSDNRDLASSSGIDVNRVIMFVWMMGGSLAALGGVLLGLSDQVQWDMGFRLLLLMFAGVTLGGLGTAYGALVGSLVVGVFVQMSTLVIPDDMKYVGGLLLLIVILVIRPQGILGSRARIG